MYLNCGLKLSLKCVILAFFNATYVVIKEEGLKNKKGNPLFTIVGSHGKQSEHIFFATKLYILLQKKCY